MGVRWSDSWREQIAPDEDAQWRAFAEQIAAVARDVSVRTGMPVDRAFHAKQHVGVRALLHVLPRLAHPLASGLFAVPRTFACYARFSNGAVRRQVDAILDVRGLALKVLDVDGARLIDDGARTQDFLFVQTPAVPTSSPAEFLALARASVDGPLPLPLRLVRALGPVRAAWILWRLALTPQPKSYFGATLYTAVPQRLGPAAMKLTLEPPTPRADRIGDTLRTDLVARLRDGALRYRVRAQLFIDERRTPIERADVAWRVGDAAAHEIAELEIPAQDLTTPEAQSLDAQVGFLGFDPWHGIEDHRPLGATQRGRRAAYALSRAQRGAAPEPTS